jgi:precorrin-2 C20-methyltransferase/precorrin-3B C17-methyltransferase
MSNNDIRPSHTGRLFGVGVGPGDPGLVTLRAAELIRGADVIAFHAGTGKQSMARSIVADLLPPGVIEEELRYPVTTGFADAPGRLLRRARGVLRRLRRPARDPLEARVHRRRPRRG